MQNDQTRRPIGARSSGWAQATARWLTGKGLTPNQISMSGMAFAAAAGLFMLSAAQLGSLMSRVLFVLAALMILARLLANLFDGMVAVEGGKAEPTGPFWNEVPDRISDTLILTAAGGVAGQWWLGLLASVLAVMTAYIREVGHRLGQPADFSGPFAKQQRMVAVMLACGLSIFTGEGGQQFIFSAALSIVVLLTAWTAVRRSTTLLNRLEVSA